MGKKKGKGNGKVKGAVRGYKIDFTNNTIIMNYTFAAAAERYGTAEYRIIHEIMRDFPAMQRMVSAGRRVTKTAPNKRLTYANMERHMSAYHNADELLAQFEKVKAQSQSCASPYKYVADWFKAQFPDYKTASGITDSQLAVAIVEAPDNDKYKQRAGEAA